MADLHSLFESCVTLTTGQHLKSVLIAIPHSRGLLLFADESDRPILLLIAADMKRLAINRLSFDVDATVASKRVRLNEITRKVYYCSCYCEFNCTYQHYRIAKQLFPSHYKDLVSFPAAAYARINIDAKWPAFTITENPVESLKSGYLVFGPFPNRKAAQNFINILEEGFGLCQQQCLIDNPQKAKSCPYHQMHTCKAPCLGNMPREEYLDQVKAAVWAASGHVSQEIAKLEQKMRHCAAAMQYEDAQVIKRQIESLDKLEKDTCYWRCDLAHWQMVHIDIGSKRALAGQKKKVQFYLAFLIRAGRVYHLGEFSIGDIDQLKQKADDALNSELAFDESLAEELSLVSYSIFRSKRSGLWIKYADLSHDNLRRLIEKEFMQQETLPNETAPE